MAPGPSNGTCRMQTIRMIDPPKGHEDHPEITGRNSRYGLALFAFYLALYGAFMLVTVFDAKVMALPAFFGVNVAIVSGFNFFDVVVE